MAPRSHIRSEFEGYVPDQEPSLPRIIGLSLVSIALALAIAVSLAALTASRARAADLSCLPGSVRAALARADAACGVKVVSTFRRGAAIAGTGGSPSMHRWCRAADFTTPQPSCVLATLADWPHALSTDYRAVKHFHIDDGAHVRFVHGQHRRHRHHRFAGM